VVGLANERTERFAVFKAIRENIESRGGFVEEPNWIEQKKKKKKKKCGALLTLTLWILLQRG
jgi:hypothetical protein